MRIFDLAHYGHYEFLERAAAYGDVVVGVHGDDVCTDYKRKPIMSCNDRCKTLSHIKHVTEILKEAPLVTTLEFMRKHKLDIVAIPEEYKNNTGGFCTEIMKSGNYIIISRTDGISTSEIIKTIIDRFKSSKDAKV
jgi:cytidyltransferase-like protein